MYMETNRINALIWNRHIKQLVLFALGLFVISCSSGVDTGSYAIPRSGEVEAIAPDVVNVLMAQEEIAILYVECLREKGFNVTDPTVNYDGTIDWDTFKSSLDDDPIYRDNYKRKSGIEDCSILLTDITISDGKKKYYDIELQDKLLRVTECLRSEGVHISDPDFSGSDTDIWWNELKENNSSENARYERILNDCSGTVFGGKK